MEQLFTYLRAEIKRAQAIQSEQSNMSQRLNAELQIGDKVWMNARSLSTAQPSQRLDWKLIGPYEVVEIVSPWAYRIKLPSQLCIHDIQPISSLEKAAQDPITLQLHEPLPPVIVDREVEYEVERIDDSRMFQRQLQYLVKWNGYDEQSWKPATNKDGLKAINDFHAKQPGKPRS